MNDSGISNGQFPAGMPLLGVHLNTCLQAAKTVVTGMEGLDSRRVQPADGTPAKGMATDVHTDDLQMPPCDTVLSSRSICNSQDL